MQDLNVITPDFSVTGAISSGDMMKFKQLGIGTVISNLPDSEVANGFTSELAKSEAETVGISYVHMPASGATVMDQNVIDQFGDILLQAKDPVLAHCKTGTRSAILWGMVSSQVTEPTQIVAQLEAQGFELDFLQDEFEEQWEIGLATTTAIVPPATTNHEAIAAGY